MVTRRVGPLTLTTGSAGALTGTDDESRGDPRRRNGRDVDRQSAAAPLFRRPRQRSPSSTRTTATSTSPGCSSCRSGWPTPRTSCGRGVASSTTGIDYREQRRSTVSTSTPTQVHLENGTTLGYDVLVVATGAVLVPEETEGLTGAGWMEKVFTFYSLEGAAALAGGARHASTAAGSSSTWSTCPSSARWRRSSSASWPTGTSTSAASATRCELTYVTPLDGAFTKPVASTRLAGLLADKGHRARDRVQHR